MVCLMCCLGDLQGIHNYHVQSMFIQIVFCSLTDRVGREGERGEGGRERWGIDPPILNNYCAMFTF